MKNKTHLKHEARDDAMEDGTLVMTSLVTTAEFEEVSRGLGGVL